MSLCLSRLYKAATLCYNAHMLYQEYQRMRQYEDDYWWYHGLRRDPSVGKQKQ